MVNMFSGCFVQYLSLLIPDSPVELLPIDAQEIFSGVDDAALDCDGSCGINVVSRHHTHCDPGTLAFQDGVWHLRAQHFLLRGGVCTGVSANHEPV